MVWEGPEESERIQRVQESRRVREGPEGSGRVRKGTGGSCPGGKAGGIIEFPVSVDGCRPVESKMRLISACNLARSNTIGHVSRNVSTSRSK